MFSDIVSRSDSLGASGYIDFGCGIYYFSFNSEGFISEVVIN
jgi:hypothetical protein